MISNLLKRWQVTWKPEVFQGWGKSKNYFEGWYLKMVNADESQAFALIPGVAHGTTTGHSFIQVMDGTKKESRYHRYDLGDFIPKTDRFAIKVALQSFNINGIRVDMPDLKGSISFSNQIKWRGSKLAPGIMGWYSFVPFMQCYHGLVSINHDLKGALRIKDELIDFNGGKGYIEKDWGSSFPKTWIWTQCNHYKYTRPISVMASVAHIPWLSSHFIGFLALIWDGEKIKIFTTYTGAEMKAQIDKDQVTLEFRDKRDYLRICASMAPGVDLISPQSGEMVGKINESLQAIHQITYLQQGQKAIECRGSSAGLEVAEKNEILLTDQWRK